ncbi:gliding motility lipoprotein GldH [Crocinitomicaceae bacterium]|nr:gliding motility lipoprotein GldH [Crocinitomicaceae bacterium]
MNKLFYIAVLVASSTLFYACDSNKVFEENQSVDDQIWNTEDIKTFSFDVTDTISPVSLAVNLRTTVDYPYSNIYMFLYSEYPDGTAHKDTIEFLLAAADGKWYGENSGTIVSFQGYIAAGGRFAKSGTYTYKLQHAMREDDLPEIVDVGLRAETMEME